MKKITFHKNTTSPSNLGFESSDSVKRKFPNKQARWGIFSGGERGIRTLDTVSRIHTFQACSFNRSDTSPDLAAPVWSVEAR